jgi:hypothetical protein
MSVTSELFSCPLRHVDEDHGKADNRPLGALLKVPCRCFSNVEHKLNGGSEIWLAVLGNGTSANIEQNDQRETRQKKSRLVSVATFQIEQ